MQRGCGVLFYRKDRRQVLLFLRDDKPEIPYPNALDIIGGSVEEGESPEEAVRREAAEEMFDRRSGAPLCPGKIALFKATEQPLGIMQHVYCHEADFEIEDIDLLEGQRLVWVTEDEVRRTPLAFGFNAIVLEFFGSQWMRS